MLSNSCQTCGRLAYSAGAAQHAVHESTDGDVLGRDVEAGLQFRVALAVDPQTDPAAVVGQGHVAPAASDQRALGLQDVVKVAADAKTTTAHLTIEGQQQSMSRFRRTAGKKRAPIVLRKTLRPHPHRDRKRLASCGQRLLRLVSQRHSGCDDTLRPAGRSLQLDCRVACGVRFRQFRRQLPDGIFIQCPVEQRHLFDLAAEDLLRRVRTGRTAVGTSHDKTVRNDIGWPLVAATVGGDEEMVRLQGAKRVVGVADVDLFDRIEMGVKGLVEAAEGVPRGMVLELANHP